jgi:hypothetical protein
LEAGLTEKSKPDLPEETIRIMERMVRMPPKPHKDEPKRVTGRLKAKQSKESPSQ